jgi:hypothetical protein
MSITLPDLMAYRGRWVAVDTTTAEVVQASLTHETLVDALLRAAGRRVVIHRVPTQDEPIFVGLD